VASDAVYDALQVDPNIIYDAAVTLALSTEEKERTKKEVRHLRAAMEEKEALTSREEGVNKLHANRRGGRQPHQKYNRSQDPRQNYNRAQVPNHNYKRVQNSNQNYSRVFAY